MNKKGLLSSGGVEEVHIHFRPSEYKYSLIYEITDTIMILFEWTVNLVIL